MESADDVRASLTVIALADLRRHEETSAAGEAGVRDLLVSARVMSWPLVVDARTGLILDGSHRAVVLARDLGARYAVAQRVHLDAADVHVESWCRVLEGVTASAFDAARRTLGLQAGLRDGLRCHYGGRVYTRAASDARDVPELLKALERLLSPNGHRAPPRLVEEDAAAAWLDAADVVVLRPPAPDKTTVRQRADGILLPPKSTRFVLPYRVFGLGLPLTALGRARDALLARLEEECARPLLCLGAGLSVDRRYPERLWQFADHRAPDRLFADEAGRRAYTDALARAGPATARPSDHRPPSGQSGHPFHL